jgi:hypothetical protein
LKTSKDANKIAGEINWYLEIKNRGIAHIAPNFISHNKDLTEYRLEYLAIPPVSDVFIFGEKSLGYWQRLFNSLSRLLLTLRETVPEDKEDFWEVKLREDYLQRLEHRLSLLLNQKPNLPKVKIQTENRLVEVGDLIQSMKMWLNKYHPVPNRFGHGDLFFGNLFYQDKTDQLMCIDPRGIKFESEVFDLEYEYAKLFHSIIGSYDFLSADLFAVDFTNDVYKLFIPLTESHRRIQNLGKEIILESRSSQGLKPDLDFNLISYLFLTLAPLHSENHLRQIAALCTAAEFFDWS